MDINQNEILFIKLKPVDSLKEESKPKWGKMSAQHMVEHLAQSLKMSNGKLDVDVVTPYKRIEVMRKVLFSNRPFPENFQNGLLPYEPPEFVTENIFFAKQMLFEELIVFYQHYEKIPHSTPTNPIFGRLNKTEWEKFHLKHFNHHFRQFGIVK